MCASTFFWLPLFLCKFKYPVPKGYGICNVFIHWLRTCSAIDRNFIENNRWYLIKHCIALYPILPRFQGRCSISFQSLVSVNIYANLTIRTIKGTVNDQSTIGLPMFIQSSAALLLMRCRFHRTGRTDCILRWGTPDKQRQGYVITMVADILDTKPSTITILGLWQLSFIYIHIYIYINGAIFGANVFNKLCKM